MFPIKSHIFHKFLHAWKDISRFFFLHPHNIQIILLYVRRYKPYICCWSEMFIYSSSSFFTLHWSFRFKKENLLIRENIFWFACHVVLCVEIFSSKRGNFFFQNYWPTINFCIFYGIEDDFNNFWILTNFSLTDAQPK